MKNGTKIITSCSIRRVAFLIKKSAKLAKFRKLEFLKLDLFEDIFDVFGLFSKLRACRVTLV